MNAIYKVIFKNGLLPAALFALLAAFSGCDMKSNPGQDSSEYNPGQDSTGESMAKPYPDFEYATVKLLSLDRTIADTASNEMSEVLMPFSSVSDGFSFLDDQGVPLHKYYTERIPGEHEIKEMLIILNFSRGEDKYVTECIPDFRDAVVFYDEQMVPLAWVSICFECKKIHFYPDNRDVAIWVFNHLEKYFTESSISVE